MTEILRASAAIESTLRRERASLLASLFRSCRDLDRAEEALQEACLRAMKHWKADGVPTRPGAWLLVVARRWLIDRARQVRREREVTDATGPVESEIELTEEVTSSADDRLHLLFAVCALELPERSRVGLALRSLLGLTTREIARAFLEKEATTAQRLVRAKRTLNQRAARPPPTGEDRAEAVDAVLKTLYLVFNEGYLAAAGDQLLRRQRMEDAIQMAEWVVELFPYHAEALALAALMMLQSSRHAARVDGDGDLVPLEEQDRSRWDHAMIARGQGLMDRVLSLHGPGGASTGPFQLQAAVAVLHSEARSPDDTDWLQIAALLRRLVEIYPSPVHELNAAVALAMSGDLRGGLRWVNAIERRGALDTYHLFAAVKAGLLERAGHLRQARRYFGRARRLASNEREKRYLGRRIREVEARLASEEGAK